MDQKIYPVDGMKPCIMRTNEAAKLKTRKTISEEALDQEEPDSDEDLNVENDNDSELITSEDGGDDIENDESELISSEDGGEEDDDDDNDDDNDDETSSDDSEDERICLGKERKHMVIVSDSSLDK
jgi:hypothetical protein